MVHQYKLGGMNIVLDVASGSVHVVDEVAYDIIAAFETETREQILSNLRLRYADRADITDADLEECYEQVASLRDSGRLLRA